jgi:hypothetical protein
MPKENCPAIRCPLVEAQMRCSNLLVGSFGTSFFFLPFLEYVPLTLTPMLILQSTGDSLASGRRHGRASGAGSPTIQCFCWPVIGFPPSFSLILFPLNFYILPPSKSCILATWKCEAALTLRRAEAADRHAPTSRISAPTLVRQTPIYAPARWSSPPAFFIFPKFVL